MEVSNLKYRSYLFFFSIVFLLIGCEKKPSTDSTTLFKIEVMERTPNSSNPAIEIASPRNDEIVSNDFSAYFASAGIDLTEEGDHLHFMLDDGDIIEHFDSQSPLNFKDVADGQHLLRVFSVKKDHTSYQSDKSIDMVVFYVNENKGTLPIEFRRPMLFLNIPSGDIHRNGNGTILLDFWVMNATMGIYDYKVSYMLDGHEGSLSLWETYAISGLSDGKHKLTIDLIDPNGKPVLGNFNHTVRTFSVKN